MAIRSQQELENARENNTFSNVTGAGITTPKGTSGFLVALLVNDANAKTVGVYDNVSAASGPIATLDAPGKGYLPFNCAFLNGLTVSAASASNLTLIYR